MSPLAIYFLTAGQLDSERLDATAMARNPQLPSPSKSSTTSEIAFMWLLLQRFFPCRFETSLVDSASSLNDDQSISLVWEM
ncbi:uncharacterized protein CCR75_002120 [Bremia lactucae]|uniref:Uncharacterized protein n=1 Tax=Bremia lactucae TaxID=4779 RepID=A0A976IAW5_BRELC|nr:hypothetical protein CCR75_002120 [Bremia lactucae]